MKISLEILREIQHLEENYKHYKRLYHRFYLLCCNNRKAVAIYHKKSCKDKIESLKKSMPIKLSSNIPIVSPKP